MTQQAIIDNFNTLQKVGVKDSEAVKLIADEKGLTNNEVIHFLSK